MDPRACALDWARAQNNLGVALAILGEREESSERLEQTVKAYEAALQEWTRERMVLGSIAVFVIDRRFIHAAAGCGVGAVLTLIGLIHSEEVHVFSNPRIALGYAPRRCGLPGVLAAQAPAA